MTACAPEEEAEFTDGESTTADGETADDANNAETEETQSEDQADEIEEDEQAQEPQGSTSNEDVLVAEVDDPVTFEECEQAERDDEATVTWLDDEVIEEERHEGLDPETVEVDGEEIEIPGAPDVVVPERVGQSGCLIEYEAPGACLPAVEISGSYIPGYQVPAREVPQVELPDGTQLPALSQDEIGSEPVENEGDRAEQECQPDEDELDDGETVSPVSRGPISRGPVSQGPESNGPESNSPTTTDDGSSVSGYSLPGYSVTGMSVSGVSIPGDSLEGFTVDEAEGTERTEHDDEVYYTTEGDVLFDSDEHQLRSDAEPELQAIADDIAERDDNYVVEVEGHTDDLPTEVYDDNNELSELRAESVVDWLIDNAEADSDTISAEGLGEDYPRADNSTDEGRQENRRVVITVTPEDHESSPDYELEDDQ